VGHVNETCGRPFDLLPEHRECVNSRRGRTRLRSDVDHTLFRVNVDHNSSLSGRLSNRRLTYQVSAPSRWRAPAFIHPVSRHPASEAASRLVRGSQRTDPPRPSDTGFMAITPSRQVRSHRGETPSSPPVAGRRPTTSLSRASCRVSTCGCANSQICWCETWN